MMKLRSHLRLGLGGLAALAVSALPALAETTHWKTVGWWDVEFFPSFGACSAVAEYDNDSFVLFGLDATGDELGMQVAILNDHWNSIVEEDEYKVVVRFDRRTPWDLTMYGTNVEGRRGLYNVWPAVSDSAGNFIEEFQASNRMVWTYQGSELGNFSLQGTRMAVNEVVACTDSFLKATGDPFATSGNGKSDPFR